MVAEAELGAELSAAVVVLLRNDTGVALAEGVAAELTDPTPFTVVNADASRTPVIES